MMYKQIKQFHQFVSIDICLYFRFEGLNIPFDGMNTTTKEDECKLEWSVVRAFYKDFSISYLTVTKID